jgi:predicted site-specific integrase-resolvase
MEADPLPTGTIIVREPPTGATGGALDARVSSAEEQDDAVRQLQRLREDAAARGALGVAEGSESAARLNDERPKLAKGLTNPKVGILVGVIVGVEHRDRRTPFGYGSIAPRLELQGWRGEARSPRDSGDGLVEECVVVITRMAARSYGRRTSKFRAERIRACGARVLHSESEDA